MINKLNELDKEIPKAGCVRHCEIMKEIRGIATKAKVTRDKEVIDKIFKILNKTSNYE